MIFGTVITTRFIIFTLTLLFLSCYYCFELLFLNFFINILQHSEYVWVLLSFTFFIILYTQHPNTINKLLVNYNTLLFYFIFLICISLHYLSLLLPFINSCNTIYIHFRSFYFYQIVF